MKDLKNIYFKYKNCVFIYLYKLKADEYLLHVYVMLEESILKINNFMLIIITIEFNSLLSISALNSPSLNREVRTSERRKQDKHIHKYKRQNKATSVI
jgi:hypothetical protein